MPFEPNAPPIAHRVRATAARDRRLLSVAARRRAVQNGGPIPAKTPLAKDVSKALKKRSSLCAPSSV
jgi:hypothetical protein